MNTTFCQNCTHVVTSGGSLAGGNDQNCWIVFIVSLICMFGLFKLFRMVIQIINPLSFFPLDLHRRYASVQTKTWALITGGSQGIGLGFAQQLAKRNFNIIIISRSQNKLQKAKQSILKINPKIQVKYISLDFEKYRTSQQYQQLVKKLNDEYDISVLVNNVGYLNSLKYLDNTYEQIKRETVINLLPITCLTRLFLPIMLERNKKFNKRSAIVNIASAASMNVLAHSANYCATKAFDDMLTRSVEAEYRNQTIDFLSVRPFLVTSDMTRNVKSILYIENHQCANGALNDLGRKSITYGPLWHRIQGVLVEELNGKLVNKLLNTVNKQNSELFKALDQKQK